MALVITDAEDTWESVPQVFDITSIHPVGPNNLYILQIAPNEKPANKIPYGAGPNLTDDQLIQIQNKISSLLQHKN